MDVGLPGAPVRARPVPAGRRDAGPWRRGGAVPLVLAAGVAGRDGLGAAPGRRRRSGRVGRRGRLRGPGVRGQPVRLGAAGLSWYDGGLAALQVAGYETVSGALRRATTAVDAAREAMVVAALLSAVALTLAARRLRLSGPATVAVPVLFGLAPAAVLLHRTADPAQLGVLWACVALALAGGGTRRTGAAVASACYLAAAAATSPLVLVALVPLFATLLWSGDLGRVPGRRRRLVAVLGVLVWAGPGGAGRPGRPGRPPGRGAAVDRPGRGAGGRGGGRRRRRPAGAAGCARSRWPCSAPRSRPRWPDRSAVRC